MKYRIKEPEIIYETFDDEVIIINLDNGNYYSAQHTAAQIWGYLAKGLSIERVIEQIQSHYKGNAAHVTQSVSAFLDQLSEDSLVVLVEEEDSPFEQQVNSSMPLPALSTLPEFEPPKLERYTDMQDLLLLDPIHDVGEQGWPNEKLDDSSDPEKDK